MKNYSSQIGSLFYYNWTIIVSLREKCPNQFFLVRIFLYSDQKKLSIWTLFRECIKPEVITDNTAQKMKFSVKDLFSKCDQIRCFHRIWSHLLKKSFIENFVFCAV